MRFGNTNEHSKYRRLKRDTNIIMYTNEINKKIVDEEFYKEENVKLEFYLESHEFTKYKLILFYKEYEDESCTNLITECVYNYDLKLNKLTVYYTNGSKESIKKCFDMFYDVFNYCSYGRLYYNYENQGIFKYEEIEGDIPYESLG